MPPTTGDLNFITVHGTYEDFNGVAIAGSISFVASTVLQDPASDLILVPRSYTATLDSSGHFSVNLPSTDDPDVSPIGWTYQVTENFVGGRQYDIQVPVTSTGQSLSIASVAPSDPNIGAQNYVLLPAFNALAAQVATAIADDTSYASFSTELAAHAAALTTIAGEITTLNTEVGTINTEITGLTTGVAAARGLAIAMAIVFGG